MGPTDAPMPTLEAHQAKGATTFSGRQHLGHGDAGERGHCCSPEPLHYSPQDQDRETRGDGTHDSACGEPKESHGEDSPHPEEVRDPPVKRDADGVGERNILVTTHPTCAAEAPNSALMRGMRTLIMVAVSTVTEDRRGDHREK